MAVLSEVMAAHLASWLWQKLKLMSEKLLPEEDNKFKF